MQSLTTGCINGLKVISSFFSFSKQNGTSKYAYSGALIQLFAIRKIATTQGNCESGSVPFLQPYTYRAPLYTGGIPESFLFLLLPHLQFCAFFSDTEQTK